MSDYKDKGCACVMSSWRLLQKVKTDLAKDGHRSIIQGKMRTALACQKLKEGRIVIYILTILE